MIQFCRILYPQTAILEFYRLSRIIQGLVTLCKNHGIRLIMMHSPSAIWPIQYRRPIKDGVKSPFINFILYLSAFG